MLYVIDYTDNYNDKQCISPFYWLVHFKISQLQKGQLTKLIFPQLKAILQLSDQTEIQLQLVQVAQELRKQKRQFDLKTHTNYEKRTFYNEIQQLERQISKVREKKLPRKQFTFSARKFYVAGESEQNNKQVDDQALKQIEGIEIIQEKQNQIINFIPKQQNQDLTIENIEKCLLIIEQPINSLYCDRIRDSMIIVNKISASFHIENALNSTFVITSQQNRIHNCKQCKFVINPVAGSIIEQCKQLVFYPRCQSYCSSNSSLTQAQQPQQIQQVQQPQKSQQVNQQWKQIKDFSFLKSNEDDMNFKLCDKCLSEDQLVQQFIAVNNLQQ